MVTNNFVGAVILLVVTTTLVCVTATTESQKGQQQQQPQAAASAPIMDEVVARMARFGTAIGAPGLALLWPIILCIGFFAVVVPIFAVVLAGLSGFGGIGGAPFAGPGLYPAAARKLGTALPNMFTPEQIINAMSMIDKTLQDFGANFQHPTKATKAPSADAAKNRVHNN